MIEIIEIKNRLSNGVTIPYVVWCSDGKSYVVKFPGNPQGKRTLVNEYVSSRICQILELPIMDFQLINVKKENYIASMKNDIQFLDGTAFGTVYDPDALPVLNPGLINKASNSYDAIKILIFDLLIGNGDRNKGNLMINSNSKKLIMIDHTHVFSLQTIWDEFQLPRFANEKFSIDNLNKFNYIVITESLDINELFYKELNKFINKVKNISEESINDILNDIPTDWEVSKNEKKELANYILSRFRRVNEILEILNLKGGDINEN